MPARPSADVPASPIPARSSTPRSPRALADVPRQRIAGAVMITDGEVHDMPPPGRLDLAAPLHVLLTGKPGEADRRLVVKDAPSFGLVGKEVQLNAPGRGSARIPDSRRRGAAHHAQGWRRRR